MRVMKITDIINAQKLLVSEHFVINCEQSCMLYYHIFRGVDLRKRSVFQDQLVSLLGYSNEIANRRIETCL